MQNSKKTIVVVGATGQQGRGVVNSLKANTDFIVRALTRNPDHYTGQADQVTVGDLNDVATLHTAFEDAYGVFVVTNFWEQGTDEIDQAKNAINAAKAAGVEHIVWSTLPDVKGISSGRYDVPHFTDKSAVDELVKAAGFKHHSFVVAAFFYQNFLTNLAPQAQQDGTTGWVLPIARDSKSIHMVDISELGDAVTGAFANPNLAGQGQYLPVVGDLLSFDEIVATLEQQGKHYSYQEVPAELFANFFPGAAELAQMFGYFQAHSYLGGQFNEQDILLEQKVAGRIPTSFTDWAAGNL
ncbi:MAG: NmrA/HSCARG family protein [Halopseudomonas sp.]